MKSPWAATYVAFHCNHLSHTTTTVVSCMVSVPLMKSRTAILALQGLFISDLFISLIYLFLQLCCSIGFLLWYFESLAVTELYHQTYRACWIFWCFHNPPNSDMDERIFIMQMWSFSMRIHRGPQSTVSSEGLRKGLFLMFCYDKIIIVIKIHFYSLFWGFLKWTTFLLILVLFIGCPLIQVCSTNSLLSVIIASARLFLTTWLNFWESVSQLCSSSDTSILCVPTHILTWSKVIFLCCAGSLEHSPLRNRVIRHHLILQIITENLTFSAVLLIVGGGGRGGRTIMVYCKVWEFFLNIFCFM